MSFVINQGIFARKIVDHFAVLGIPIDADPKVVRKAYLKIAQRLHPDTCPLTDAKEKHLASELLSKLVNPAYEKLSKPVAWSEHQVILVQLSQQLSHGTENLGVQTSGARELLKATTNLPDLYREKVAALAELNYRQIETVLEAIAELSELNLVYLQYLGKQKTVETKETIFQKPEETKAPATATATTTPAASKDTLPFKTTSSSSLEAALWRGEEHFNKQNYTKAVLEFRDAIKIDPNCVKAHTLMGMAYLKQNQVTMAKIHIKKAYSSEPKDPLVKQAKQALEQAMGQPLSPQSSGQKGQDNKKGGLFGGLFGGKKK